MEVSFLIFKKDDTKTISDFEVKRLLSVLSNTIDEESFSFFYEDVEYRLNYLISKDGNKRRLLKIIIESTEFRGAIILDAIRNMLIQGEHRSKYYITILYDDASSCFCKKGMPYIGAFERRLRELIYLILIKTYGIEWTDKTLSEQINEKLKRYNKTKLIESALEQMDIGDLENYLFQERRFVDSESWLDEFFKNTNFETIEKQELIRNLNTLRKTTLWDLYFADIEPVQGIKDKLEKIRDYRNKVMHNKTFMYAEYLDLKNIIKPLSKDLLKAIEAIENNAFTEPMGYVSAAALVASLTPTLVEASRVAQSIVESMKPILERSASIYEAISNSMSGFAAATEEARKNSERIAKSIGPILANLALDFSASTEETDDESTDDLEELDENVDEIDSKSSPDGETKEDNKNEPEKE